MLALFFKRADNLAFPVDGRREVGGEDSWWNFKEELDDGANCERSGNAEQGAAGGEVFRFGGEIHAFGYDLYRKLDGKAECSSFSEIEFLLELKGDVCDVFLPSQCASPWGDVA